MMHLCLFSRTKTLQILLRVSRPRPEVSGAVVQGGGRWDVLLPQNLWTDGIKLVLV